MKKNQKLKFDIRHGSWHFYVLTVLSLFAVVTALPQFNLFFFRFLNNISSVTGENIWIVLTFFSDGLVSFVVLTPFLKKKPKIIFAVIIATAVSTLLNQILKRSFHIQRPTRVLDRETMILIGPDWGQYSFPSGHSAMIFVLASVISALMNRSVKTAVLSSASLIALSRAVVGVHWPFDIAVGAMIGWASGWIGIFISEKAKWGYGRKASLIYAFLLSGACVVLFLWDYSGFEGIMFFQRAVAFIFMLFSVWAIVKILKDK
ncbi:phosphatase PAP2 family protein [candidate division WOR-3 bacterium]|nr:phosphatase PAP2 family protein [candidate division WOR-3 bacterium]